MSRNTFGRSHTVGYRNRIVAAALLTASALYGGGLVCAGDLRGGDPSPPLRSFSNSSFSNSVGIELVLLPKGSFVRGGSESDPDAGEDEFPSTAVTVDRELWFGRYEITQGEFAKVMGENPAWFGPNGPGRSLIGDLSTENWPLDNASWKDAVEFCRRLSDLPPEKLAGRRYRLPTETEWEYACRAGTTTVYSVGDELRPLDARFGDTSREGHPVPVGSFAANPWGLHDLHGNVWEWCSDRYTPDSYSARPPSSDLGISPPLIPGGTARVVRGGDWRAAASYCRSSNRDLTRESRRDIGNGFRIVCEIAPPG